MKKIIILLTMIAFATAVYAAQQNTWPAEQGSNTWPQASEGNTWPAETWPSETDSQTWPAETWPATDETNTVKASPKAEKSLPQSLSLFGKEWIFSHTNSTLLFKKRYNFVIRNNKTSRLFIGLPEPNQEDIKPVCEGWDTCNRKGCSKSKNVVWQLYAKQKENLRMTQTAKGPKVSKETKSNVLGLMFVDQQGNVLYIETISSENPEMDKQIFSQTLCKQAPDIISTFVK